MKPAHILLEFLQKLIQVQINKYVELTEIGIGPDALMNAALVYDEVNDLFKIADTLLSHIQSPSTNHINIAVLYEQVRFYLEQEYWRGKAGFLIDENNIHSGEMIRLEQQLAFIKQFASDYQIDIKHPALPHNETQRRCLHDSHAIAHFILELAIQVKSDPDTQFSDRVPKHAEKILRRHAKANGRYHNQEIYQQIENMFDVSERFLSHSVRHKSELKLTKENALKMKVEHQAQLDALAMEYRSIKSSSKMSSVKQFGLFALSVGLPPLLLLLQKYIENISSENLQQSTENTNLLSEVSSLYYSSTCVSKPW